MTAQYIHIISVLVCHIIIYYDDRDTKGGDIMDIRKTAVAIEELLASRSADTATAALVKDLGSLRGRKRENMTRLALLWLVEAARTHHGRGKAPSEEASALAGQIIGYLIDESKDAVI